MQEAKASKVIFQFNTNSLELTITNLAEWATQNRFNIAIYRKPGKDPMFLLDPSDAQKVNRPVEELESGFLFADYDGNAWHMQAAVQINLANQEISGDLGLLPLKKYGNGNWNYFIKGKAQRSTTSKEYEDAVQACVDKIGTSELIKVVPTKVKYHKLSGNFSLAEAFKKLCEAYPTAFVSVVSTKEFGTWLTATPEMLIDVDGEGIFKTMALAGTQKYDPEVSLHEVAWTDKEIEEQAMVSRYIINRLKEIRLREFIEEGPMTVRAANLTHLCSTFTVDTKATSFPNLGGVMLNLLHPTSAVCGMPKQPAVELIKEIEQHKRKFYTGYLGPVNMENATSIYVNLRCMELFDGSANLFAGAGVTAFSNPEKEWEETELKCNTLLNVIE
ncbi:MAG: chorismate-binding protein [Cyclobacteriaceae bacterium]|nr:chorismate-binding protein [Cyclobacteriaceae bacterium]